MREYIIYPDLFSLNVETFWEQSSVNLEYGLECYDRHNLWFANDTKLVGENKEEV